MDEIELKGYFLPSELDRAQEVIFSIKNQISKNWTNVQIEDTFYDLNDQLRTKGITLRHRAIGDEHYLTYKGSIDKSTGYKIRDEVEFQVLNNDDLIKEFLIKLGYKIYRVITKVREYVRYNHVLITIDYFAEIGIIIELEGSKDKIEETIHSLHLCRKRFQPLSYDDVRAIYAHSKPI